MATRIDGPSDEEMIRVRAERAEQARRAACYPELLAACNAVLSDVSLDVYRVAAAQWGRMAPAEAAFALLRAAIAKATSPQAR